MNAANLRRELREALSALMLRSGYTPAKFRYWAKFLTLTLPGREWRSMHTPAEAEKIIKAGWRKLRNSLRKHHGDFEYVQVDELQPSGYPHLHVLMVGEGIASRDILDFVRAFWVDYLGLGNPDIRLVDDLEKASAYLTKYISKSKSGVLVKGNRVFSFSKGLKALAKGQREARRVRVTPIRVGFMNSDGTFGKTFWERDSGQSLVEAQQRAVLKDLMDFFDHRKNGQGEQEFFWDGLP